MSAVVGVGRLWKFSKKMSKRQWRISIIILWQFTFYDVVTRCSTIDSRNIAWDMTNENWNFLVGFVIVLKMSWNFFFFDYYLDFTSETESFVRWISWRKKENFNFSFHSNDNSERFNLIFMLFMFCVFHQSPLTTKGNQNTENCVDRHRTKTRTQHRKWKIILIIWSNCLIPVCELFEWNKLFKVDTHEPRQSRHRNRCYSDEGIPSNPS